MVNVQNVVEEYRGLFEYVVVRREATGKSTTWWEKYTDEEAIHWFIDDNALEILI